MFYPGNNLEMFYPAEKQNKCLSWRKREQVTTIFVGEVKDRHLSYLK